MQDGDLSRAATLAAAAARECTGSSLPRFEQRLRDETGAAIEAALAETAYAEARAEGAALGLEAAVAAARALAAVR